MKTTFSNEQKAKIFNDWLGSRFATFEVATPDTAPISFVATDHEGKQYFVFVNVADELLITDNNRDQTGIIIDNTHFYHLYAMISQGQNVFWFEVFNNGYMLFYLNDCCTGEQLNVLPEQTLIGVTSALHIEKPVTKIDNKDGTYSVSKTTTKPTIIQGSLELPKMKVLGRKKKK